MTKQQLDYKSSGVDIDAGNALVERIKKIVPRTHRKEVLTGIGGFAALFELPIHRYKQPLLVSSTDGVGTKLKLALLLNRHKTVGIDLVAMCVNDLVVVGAEPLFFLDYYATGKLDVNVAADVIEGIATGCELAGAALVGGETAELPGMYQDGDYDLAGFTVGVVEKEHVIDGAKVKAGDTLIALGSSGLHSNGYSLARKILDVTKADPSSMLGQQTLGDALITPTRIYVKSILKLINELQVNAIAHITGGGLLENIPRVLPKNLAAKLAMASWTRPAIFNWLQEMGNVAEHEMRRTFNCGVGMVVCVPSDLAENTIALLKANGETAWKIGEIVSREEGKDAVIFEG